MARMVSRLSVLTCPSLHPFPEFLGRGQEDRPVLRDLGLIAQLFVGVGLQALGLGVRGVGKDQVVQQLHRPPVIPGVDRGAALGEDLVPADQGDVPFGVVVG